MSLNKRDRTRLDHGEKVYGDKKVIRNQGEEITFCLFILTRPYHQDSNRMEDHMLEEGWKIRSSPPHSVRVAARERRKNPKYLLLRELRVGISPQLWEKLKSQGYIGTRSLYDRIELNYWEEGMRP